MWPKAAAAGKGADVSTLELCLLVWLIGVIIIAVGIMIIVIVKEFEEGK